MLILYLTLVLYEGVPIPLCVLSKYLKPKGTSSKCSYIPVKHTCLLLYNHVHENRMCWVDKKIKVTRWMCIDLIFLIYGLQ